MRATAAATAAVGLLLLLAPAAVRGAGMSTHTMVGYRAQKYFGKVLASPNASLYNAAIAAQPESVAAGSDFPDFLYACGKYADHHDAGEAAHWPPWQAVSLPSVQLRPTQSRVITTVTVASEVSAAVTERAATRLEPSVSSTVMRVFWAGSPSKVVSVAPVT